MNWILFIYYWIEDYLKKLGLISLNIIHRDPRTANAMTTLIIFCFPSLVWPIAIWTPHRMTIAKPQVMISVINIWVIALEIHKSVLPSEVLEIHLHKKGILVLRTIPPLHLQIHDSEPLHLSIQDGSLVLFFSFEAHNHKPTQLFDSGQNSCHVGQFVVVWATVISPRQLMRRTVITMRESRYFFIIDTNRNIINKKITIIFWDSFFEFIFQV